MVFSDLRSRTGVHGDYMSGGKLSIFIPINKIDEENRLVYGEVASETPDNAGETFDYEKSKPFFQKWSDNACATSGGKSYGNLRVMHTSKVAGKVASPLGFDDEAKRISACTKVVDDDEWKKVLTGCYTGFSMGGRYVERINKGTEKRYVADPVEISLVDKPCIPTATFEVIKADGTTETRNFSDGLWITEAELLGKADNGEPNMPAPVVAYEPTNDEMLPVAKELAKAAGDENKWLDFVSDAKEQLIAKHTGLPTKDDIAKADDAHDPEKCDKVDCPDCAAASKADTANKGDNPFAGKDGEEEEEAGAKDAKDGDTKDGEDADEGEEAKKADDYQLSQFWKAKDGTLFAKKADAIAHNDKVEKREASEPSVADQLRAAAEEADRIAKGEIGDPKDDSDGDDGSIGKADILAVFEPLAKLIEFRDDKLVKGLFEVRELSQILQNLEVVHSMATCEAGWEGDASTVPAQILAGLKTLGEALISMAQEEVTELLARAMGEAKEVEGFAENEDAILLLAAGTLGLEKTALTDTLQKRNSEPTGILAKVASLSARADAAEKAAAAANNELEQIVPLVKSLQTSLDEIKKLPMPKAPTTVLGKGENPDAGKTGDPADPLNKYSMEQLQDAAIRLAHQQGHTVHIGTPA